MLPAGVGKFGMNGRPLGLEPGDIEKQKAKAKKEQAAVQARLDAYEPYEGEKMVPVPPCNWRAAFSGSVWEFDENTQEFYLHLFCKEQPDLVSGALSIDGTVLVHVQLQNWELPEVREAIYENAVRYWLDKGVDGFRCV